MLPISTYSSYDFIEKSLNGDLFSSLSLIRALCLSPDSEKISSDLDLEISLLSIEHPSYFVELFSAFLQARKAQNGENYRLAKERLRILLLESNQNNCIARSMLIYIKVFSLKTEKEACDQPARDLTPKFLKAITDTKLTGNCFDEIFMKEALLEYLLNDSLNEKEIEMGLQMQLSMIHDVDLMENSQAYKLDDLMNRQLERYLCLLIKLFGEEKIDSNFDLEAKRILELAKNNHSLSSQRRNLAEFHLGNLLLREEFPKICDIPEGYYLLNNFTTDNEYYFYAKLALIKFDTFSIAEENLITSIRNPLLELLKYNNESKSFFYYILGLSYLPKSAEEAKNFNIEAAYHCFKIALQNAHPSSFLIPLANFYLIILFIFKDNKSSQELENTRKSIANLFSTKNLDPDFLTKINYFSEIISKIDLQEVNAKSNSQNVIQKQLFFHGFQLIASENHYQIYDFLNTYNEQVWIIKDTDKIKVIDEVNPKQNIMTEYDTAPGNIREEVKSKLIEALNQGKELEYSYFSDLISQYINWKTSEISNDLDEKLGKNLYIGIRIIKSEFNIKKVEIFQAELAKNLYKIFSELDEQNANLASLYFPEFICNLVSSLGEHLRFDKKTITNANWLSTNIINEFVKIVENEQKNNTLILKNLRASVLRNTNILLCSVNDIIKKFNTYEKNWQEELIFQVYFNKISIHQSKFLLKQINYNRLATSYKAFGGFFLATKGNGKAKSDLHLEMGRLYYSYYSHGMLSENETWEDPVCLDLATNYTNAFGNAPENLSKYEIIGSEILRFGPKFIKDYIRDNPSHPLSPAIPDLVFTLYLISFRLLRFQNREKEANELIDSLKFHRGLEQFVFDRLIKKQSKKGNIALRNPLATIEIIIEFFASPIIFEQAKKNYKGFNYYKYPNLKKQIEIAKGLEWFPYPDFTFETTPEKEETKKEEQPSQISKKIEKKSVEETKKEENKDEEIYFQFQDFQKTSTKVEVKKNAKCLLENQERKQKIKEQKKENRPPRLAIPLEVTSNTSLPVTGPKIFLTPNCMKIFNKLWQPRSGALNKSFLPPFDPHDYRDDGLKLTRQQVKKLILDLGGKYIEKQGKGSHETGIIVPIKLIIGEEEMTLANFTTSDSENVTLPQLDDDELIYYQVFQLRDKLIKLGYTPETVQERL